MKKNKKTKNNPTSEIALLLKEPSVEETQHLYNSLIEEIKRKVRKFSDQAYDRNLTIGDLKKLKRKLIKAANIFENEIKDDTRFLHIPPLHQEYLQKGEEAARRLRALIPVVNSSIEELSEDIEPIENTNPRTKLLLLREFGLLDLLIDKLSIRKNGSLNDKQLSKVISLITGVDVYKDLFHVYYNTVNSKDERPIDTASVAKVQTLLAPLGLQVKNLPIIKDKK